MSLDVFLLTPAPVAVYLYVSLERGGETVSGLQVLLSMEVKSGLQQVVQRRRRRGGGRGQHVTQTHLRKLRNNKNIFETKYFIFLKNFYAPSERGRREGKRQFGGIQLFWDLLSFSLPLPHPQWAGPQMWVELRVELRPLMKKLARHPRRSPGMEECINGIMGMEWGEVLTVVGGSCVSPSTSAEVERTALVVASPSSPPSRLDAGGPSLAWL